MQLVNYVLVIITEDGLSIETLPNLNADEATSAYHIAKFALEKNGKVALYRKIESS